MILESLRKIKQAEAEAKQKTEDARDEARRLIEEAKKPTSKWLKSKGAAFGKFSWQSGYGAFSVSPSRVENVTAYIARQEEHHQTVTFQEEFRRFLEEYGVDYDERYVWD